MTTIFVDPSELRENSKFPANLAVTECPGLEALTGADFVISSLPINPVTNLEWHKSNRSLFVQRKSGYDVFSFEQTNLEIARMKAAGLSMQQCVLLFIGRCYPDAAGLAVIDGRKPHGETTYKTFEKRIALIEGRGVKFNQIASANELATWIDSRVEAIEDMGGEPVKRVQVSPFVNWADENDPWQEVITPAKDTAEYGLVCGFDGLGPKTIEAARATCEECHIPPTGINLLKVLTYRDNRGKLLYDVKGWGDKSADKLRRTLGLIEHVYLPEDKSKWQNILTTLPSGEDDTASAWWNGVNDGLDTVEMLAKEHKITDAKKLLYLARRAALPFGLVSKTDIDRWLGELYCDDWLKKNYPEIYQEFIKGATSK